MTKKRTVHKSESYRRWYNDLKKIHNFSFRFKPKSDFTPAQKAAITKLHKKHKTKIKHINEGRAVFKPVKKASQRRQLQQRFDKTNKGLIIYGSNIRKVKIKGKGIKTQLTLIRKSTTEVYHKKRKNEPITDLINRVIATEKPDHIVLAVNTYRGTRAYTESTFNEYDPELLALEEQIMGRWNLSYDESPFNGCYAVYITE